MAGGKGNGKVNSHPPGRDNSRLGLSAFIPKLSWLRRQHRWDGVAFASMATSRGLQELFFLLSGCLAAAEAGTLLSAARFDCSSCGFGAYIPAIMHGSIC